MSCLSKLKVTPSFCFAFKIPDDPTATNIYWKDKLLVFAELVFWVYGPFGPCNMHHKIDFCPHQPGTNQIYLGKE